MGRGGHPLFTCAATVLAGLAPALLVGLAPAAPEARLTATALMMGGTGQVLSIPPTTPAYMREFVEDAKTRLVVPSGLCVGGDPGCSHVVVYTPEELGFLTGLGDLTLDESVAAGRANLDACLRGAPCLATSAPFTDTLVQRFSDSSYLVEGISQSSVVATVEKRHLLTHPVGTASVSFFLESNINRPNGGLFERFPGFRVPVIGMTFNGATPTNSPRTDPMPTIDVAHQYDGWVDFPTNPANLLADLNAVLGLAFLHNKPLTVGGSSLLQGFYQDSTYYLKPSPVLPLLIPLAAIPAVGRPLALSLDPPLRVLVEAGYDRTVNPGQPTPAQWRYTADVARTAVNLVRSVPTGWDDAIAYMTKDSANRPFHTEPQGAYGVGGPPVYAGAIDAYGPQSAVVADPQGGMAESVAAQRGPGPGRLAGRGSASAMKPQRPARHSVKIATARVQPADAA